MVCVDRCRYEMLSLSVYCLCQVGCVAYVYTGMCMGGLNCRKCLSGVAGIGEDGCVQRL